MQRLNKLPRMTQLFRTHRTIIDTITLEDTDFIISLVNTPDWLRFIGDPKVRDEHDARKFIQSGFLRCYAENGFGYYLIRTLDLTPIGICGFLKKPYLEHVDFGFALHHNWYGQGLARESAAAVLEYGVKRYKFTALDAVTSPLNVRSKHLLDKLGFALHATVYQPDATEELDLFRWQRHQCQLSRDIIRSGPIGAEYMKYFAYGSNMSLARLRARVPCAKRLGTYWLDGHDLRFHKASGDGSGKCDAFQTDDGSRIHGAVFEISRSEKTFLDSVEGLGAGYLEKVVYLHNDEGETIEALTYYATDIKSELKPYSWYANHVLIGARESGLPTQYVQRIENTESIRDKQHERDRAERAIHAV